MEFDSDTASKPRLGYKVCKHCGKDENQVQFYKNRNTVCAECSKTYRSIKYHEEKDIKQNPLPKATVIPEEVLQPLRDQVEQLKQDLQLYTSQYKELTEIIGSQQNEIDYLKSKLVNFRPDSPINITSPEVKIISPEPIKLPPLPHLDLTVLNKPEHKKSKADKYITKILNGQYTRSELESLAKDYRITISVQARKSKQGVQDTVLKYLQDHKDLII